MKKTWKIDIDCPNCAAKVERALQKLPGVVGASVNYVQKKITLEAPADRFEKVRKAAYAKMKEIEPDAEIFFDEAEEPSGTVCPCGGHHHEDDDDNDEHCGCGTANAAAVTSIITMTTMMTMTTTSITSTRMNMVTNTAARTRARN